MGMLLRRHYEAAEEVPEEETPVETTDEAPNGNASKADWHAYALTQGYAEEGLEGRTRDELRALFEND